MRESKILESRRWEFLPLAKPRLEDLYKRSEYIQVERKSYPKISWNGKQAYAAGEIEFVNSILDSNQLTNEEKYIEFYQYLLDCEKYERGESQNTGVRIFTTNNKKNGSKIYYRGDLEKNSRDTFIRNGFAITMGSNQVINIRTLKRDQNGNYKIDGEIRQLFPNGYIVKGQPLHRVYKGERRTKGKRQRNIKNENFEIDFSKQIVFSKRAGHQFIGKANAIVQPGNQTPIVIKGIEGTLIENIEDFYYEVKYPPNANGLAEGKLITSYGIEACGLFDENYALQGRGTKSFGFVGDSRNNETWSIAGDWSDGQPIDGEYYQVKFSGIEFEAKYQEELNKFVADNVEISSNSSVYKGSLEIPLGLKKTNPSLRFNEYFQGIELKPKTGNLIFKVDNSSFLKFTYCKFELLDRYELGKDCKSKKEGFSQSSTTKPYLEKINLRSIPEKQMASFFKSRLSTHDYFDNFEILELGSLVEVVGRKESTSLEEVKNKVIKEVQSILFLMQNTKLENRKQKENHLVYDLKNGYFVKQYRNGLNECCNSQGELLLSFKVEASGDILELAKYSLDKKNRSQCLLYEKQTSGEKLFIGKELGSKKGKLRGVLLKEDGERLEGTFSKTGAIQVHGKYRQHSLGRKTLKVKYNNGQIVEDYTPIDKTFVKSLVKANMLKFYSKKVLTSAFLLFLFLGAIYNNWDNYAMESSFKEFPISLKDRQEMIDKYKNLSVKKRYKVFKNLSKMFYLKNSSSKEYRQILDLLLAYDKEQKAYHNTIVLAEYEGMHSSLPGMLKIYDGLLIPSQTNKSDPQLRYVREFIRRAKEVSSHAKKQNVLLPNRESFRKSFAEYKAKMGNW